MVRLATALWRLQLPYFFLDYLFGAYGLDTELLRAAAAPAGTRCKFRFAKDSLRRDALGLRHRAWGNSEATLALELCHAPLRPLWRASSATQLCGPPGTCELCAQLRWRLRPASSSLAPAAATSKRKASQPATLPRRLSGDDWP